MTSYVPEPVIFGRIDVPKITGSGPYEVIEFRNSFDARESSAGNHEGEQGAPQFGVRFDISYFEAVNDPVSQHQRVAKILEWESMLREPRLADEVCDVANRNDEMIVRELAGPRPNARARGHGPVCEVNRL